MAEASGSTIGINAWIGGSALHTFFAAVLDFDAGQVLTFAASLREYKGYRTSTLSSATRSVDSEHRIMQLYC